MISWSRRVNESPSSGTSSRRTDLKLTHYTNRAGGNGCCCPLQVPHASTNYDHATFPSLQEKRK
ncbi:hypothetical protein BO85DRAFT_444984 [Aspergillus piperis CBS 112811]|uniref:Uncharacterized protein n=1 Tax=Aspergillus piperis CBS 112811 TaxID=1448313 RepID=A0A8G1VQ18_9EURO|nr:hypothetical protein BO85DRAFT_444984 [Aspergillus piperis CBS 112811]RAH61549.1 hypothetical protein BO85DRAFT_444984 [Aspergillus piperis CBS 112811]